MRERNDTRWREVAEVATRQHGVVCHRDLRAAGLSPSAIGRAAATGRLHRIHLGVYAVGHRALVADGLRLAAVLACGDRAVLSHTTAAAVWEVRPSASGLVHVTVPTDAGRRPPRGVRLHRCAALRDEERAVVGTMPVTSLARTLLDVARGLSPAALARVLDRSEVLGLFDARAVDAVLAAHAGQPGTRRLRDAVAAHAALGATLTRSALEDAFLALCDDHALPRPQANVVVCGVEVDFLFPRGLVVEADGRRHHSGPLAFERDRERDAALLVAGFRVLRLTHRRITREPAEVARLVRAALAAPRVAP
jgi:hypothetical protein